MPELPEVENVKQALNKNIKNLIIKDIKIIDDKILVNSDALSFIQKLKKEKIEKIDRKGKYLLFFLTNFVLIVHLRMEGKFNFYNLQEIKTRKMKHVHLLLFFNNEKILGYHDFRKFGKWELYPRLNFVFAKYKQIGPEPFFLKSDVFFKQIQNRKKNIKQILLDQKIIAGLGNIYANEVLFLSKIKPDTLAKNLSVHQAKLIINNSQQILRKAINLGGTSISSFSIFSKKGYFQKELLVYNRKGLKCLRCEQQIQKIKLNGRGTYFCPGCQK